MNTVLTPLVIECPMWVRPLLQSIGKSSTAMSAVPLHLGTEMNDMTLVFIILGGIISSILASMSVFAFSQRRSRPYLLVSLALGMLAAKAFIGGLTVFRIIPTARHHMIEHGLDFITALLLIAAVIFARMESGGSESRFRSDATDDEQADVEMSSGYER
jgi:heme A synthase